MSTLPDWTQIFSDVDGILPLHEDPDFVEGSPSVVRRMYVDLAEVREAAASRNDPFAPVEVYADVVRVPAACRFVVGALKIHARRLEAAAGAGLEIDNRLPQPDETIGVATPAILEVYVGDVVVAGDAAAMPVTAFGMSVALAVSLHAEYRFPENDAPARLVRTPVPAAPPGDAWAHALQLMEAERLASREPENGWIELAVDIARWVNRCSAHKDGDPRLFAESAALLQRLTGPARHLSPIPYLNRASYEKLASQTLAALRDVEAKYNVFFDRKAQGQERVEQGRAMLKHYQNAQGYSRRLLEQAEDNMKRAQEASEASAKKLEQQLETVAAARTVFEEGVGAKRKEAETKAGLAIAGCVLAVGAAIALACVGSPAGVAGVTSAAKQAQALAAELKRLQETMSKIAKIIDTLKKISAALKTLAEIGEFIKKHVDAFAAVKRLEETLDQLSQSDTEPMTVRDWEVFQEDMRVLFQNPIELGVDGAVEYHKQLNILAIRGKDGCDTGLHFGLCGQAYQRQVWETQRDQADIEETEQQLARLADKNEINFSTSLFYQRLRDDLRGRLVLAIRNLNATYRYFALAQPRVSASMGHDAGDLTRLLVQATEDIVDAKERFNPRPSQMKTQYEIDAPHALVRLRDQRAVSFHIPMAGNFKGFFRVRVRELNVWLVGARHAANVPIYVAIATSGQYEDRLPDARFEFASLPMNLTFVYEYTDEGEDKDPNGTPVTIRGRSDDALQAYYEPTPFTTWSLFLPRDYNEKLDLSGLTKIRLEFEGTYVGDPTRMKMRTMRETKMTEPMIRNLTVF